MTFKAPSYMRNVAIRSLEERMYYPESSRPMTSTGIKRAKQLAANKPLSVKDLIDMRSFLIRHRQNFRPWIIDNQGRFTKGTISYWAWGGTENDRSLIWVENQLEKVGYL
jgi:hypothetical protein